ncbi:glycoside hydrolase domain-containing protein [Bacillus taeanensis]|uniref:Rv2525c-like glycoside hydrolase-like domain-containing protein n=1 Tax=Bacillus taeanensis TaxID=273032 RepID=A0A366XMW5_9BACI|nr:glycoside hydrolase domain-containing protein [Bacillus taeanensis]RBW67690.1 hypothetical protein DS031_20675 [Bacillus taeanensis]
MKWGKYTTIVGLTFLLFISIITFSSYNQLNTIKSTLLHMQEAVQSNVSENTNESAEDTEEKNSISNHVENNVDGNGNRSIDNSIENNIDSNGENEIDNNIKNNIEVNVDVSISNNIKNNVKSNEQENSSTDSEKSSSSNNNSNKNSENQNNNDEKKNEKQQNFPELVWGVDSASVTTEEMCACVEENFGTPSVWGRYLGTKEDVSKGISKEEAQLIHNKGAKVLLIFNHFTEAIGYEKGKTEANEAIRLAENLGVPEDVAIFADIEPSYPVDSAFINGWYDVISASPYKPGIYGIFDSEKALVTAFNAAAKNNENIKKNTYIWTAAPNIGVTTEANAPEYKPESPEGSLTAGWQYGIDAKACNIDTNLFKGEILKVLW